MKHRGWILCSGSLWMAIGLFLAYKASHYWNLAEASSSQILLFVVIGSLVGVLKANFVLSKTVNRTVNRITSLSLPIRFSQVFGPSYLVLIGVMMGLGFLMRVLPISLLIKGTIDYAIGVALIQGAMMYFRAARKMAAVN